jgi:hypothetical protein
MQYIDMHMYIRDVQNVQYRNIHNIQGMQICTYKMYKMLTNTYTAVVA